MSALLAAALKLTQFMLIMCDVQVKGVVSICLYFGNKLQDSCLFLDSE